MPQLTEATTAAELALCTCIACGKRNGTAVAPVGTLHSYESTPRGGWVARRVATDPADLTAPTFGCEVEVDGPGRPADLLGRPATARLYPTPEELGAIARWERRNQAHIAAQRAAHLTVDEACAVAAPRGMFLPAQDGSLRNGVEFKGQPATLRWYMANRPHLASMFKALIHGGFRAHDAGTAGLHINVGIDAFNGQDGRLSVDHIERFATLWVVNPRFTVRLSGRTHEQLRWAEFTRTLTDPVSRRQWAESIARDGYVYDHHTQCLNASHSGRIEVRTPRGTLNLATFMARVQWVAAVVEFTRDPASRPTPAGFIAYVKVNQATYPDLFTYAADRMPSRFERVA